MHEAVAVWDRVLVLWAEGSLNMGLWSRVITDGHPSRRKFAQLLNINPQSFQRTQLGTKLGRSRETKQQLDADKKSQYLRMMQIYYNGIIGGVSILTASVVHKKQTSLSCQEQQYKHMKLDFQFAPRTSIQKKLQHNIWERELP